MLRPLAPPPRRRAISIAPPPRIRPLPEPRLLPVLPITIVFLDLSLTSTGVALYRHGEVNTERWTPRTSGVERLAELDDRLRSLLIREYPDAVGVEGYSYASKNARAHSTGEWGGVARLAIRSRPRTKGYIVPPSTLKKFITGNHQAKKPEMVLHLYKRYGIEVPQEDEADAACGSILIGAHLYESAFSLTQFQRSALTKGVEPMS